MFGEKVIDMSVYHVTSIFIDIFYLLDLIGDCRYYAYEDEQDIVISDQTKIWQRMKKKKARIFFKFLLCFPFYLFDDKLYCIKLLSGMHLRTMLLFLRKSAVMVQMAHTDLDVRVSAVLRCVHPAHDGPVRRRDALVCGFLPRIHYWLDLLQVSSAT